MILKALYDYYHRSGNLPTMGMELKEIGFIIVIDKYDNITKLSRGDRADLREEKKPKERSEKSS